VRYIAREFFLSRNTARGHVAGAYRNLDVTGGTVAMAPAPSILGTSTMGT